MVYLANIYPLGANQLCHADGIDAYRAMGRTSRRHNFIEGFEQNIAIYW